jgi:putative endonuclease
MWHLYLIECADGAFYAGISTDVDARFAAHCAGKGARYTRANPPRRLLGSAPFPDRASASRAEWEMKQLKRDSKPMFLQWLVWSAD